MKRKPSPKLPSRSSPPIPTHLISSHLNITVILHEPLYLLVRLQHPIDHPARADEVLRCLLDKPLCPERHGLVRARDLLARVPCKLGKHVDGEAVATVRE